MFDRVLRLTPGPTGELLKRRGARAPHAPETLERVRRLIETTALTYRAVAAATGVSIATIARHAAAEGWCRPVPPRSIRPTPEARRRARRAELAARLLRRAERLVEEIETDPRATPAALAGAARLLKLSERLDRPERPRPRRRRRAPGAASTP